MRLSPAWATEALEKGVVTGNALLSRRQLEAQVIKVVEKVDKRIG